MPALFTRMDGSPMRAATDTAAASIDARFVMSQSKHCTPSPTRCLTSSNRAVGTAVPRSSAATRAPASTSASTQIAPSFPLAPVTTAICWSREKRPLTDFARREPECVDWSRTRELWVGLAQHLEGQEVVLVKRLERDPPDDLVELVRRDPAARRLHDDVTRFEHVAARQIPGDDEALAHLDDRSTLAVVDLLGTVAHRFVRALEIAHHLAQTDRLERERMIGALHRAIEREVLLHDAGTQNVGS